MSPAVNDPTTDFEGEDYAGEPEAPPPPRYGVNNRQLPDQLKRALTDAIREAQSSEKFIRREETLQDAKYRFYDMGIQHLFRDAQWNWTAATPGGSYSTGPNSKNYFSDYIDDYNIFAPFAQIGRAKLSEHDPGIDFQPDDPNEPDDVESAKAAEAMRHDFDRNNDTKLLQQQIVYYWQMGGRCVTWTRTEDSAPRYGDTSGNPPRQVVTTAYGTIESKVPVFANTLADYGYCILYDDPELKEAKQRYSWIAPKLSAGAICLDENSYERIARLGLVQNSAGVMYGYGWNAGDSMAHLISRGNCFLRTSRFEGFDDPLEQITGEDDYDPETGAVVTVKEKLLQIFPDGAHVVCVGSEYAESFNRNMDDCLAVSRPYIGKGQTCMPIMRPMAVLQDRFNQGMNLIAESQDYLVPSTWLSCGVTEYAAITKQRAKPGAFRNLKELPTGKTIQDMVYREPDYQIPDSAMKFLEYISGAIPQFILAMPPAMWGESMSDNRTASGLQLAAAQAMGIQGALWDQQTEHFSQIYYQNCIAISDDDNYPDEITIPNLNGQRAVVQKVSLTKGKFRCFPDKESGFPESTMSQRQAMERVVALLAPTPLGMEVMGAPENAAALVRLSGVPLVIPSAISGEKQSREIEKLLATEPTLAPPILMLLRGGADVPTIVKAIDQARQMQAQQYAQQLQAFQVQEQQAQTEHAGTVMAGQPTGPAPMPGTPPPPPDPSQIAKSSVTIWPSDVHKAELKKCQDYLIQESYKELTIGRPSPSDPFGPKVPNVAGVLNVLLHAQEHLAAIPLTWLPQIEGPLPAVGSPPTMAPQPSGS